MEVGGWVQVSLRIFLGKSSQNSPKPVLIFWSSIPCVFCLYKILPRARRVAKPEVPCHQLQLSPTFGVQCDERDVWAEIVHGVFRGTNRFTLVCTKNTVHYTSISTIAQIYIGLSLLSLSLLYTGRTLHRYHVSIYVPSFKKEHFLTTSLFKNIFSGHLIRL